MRFKRMEARSQKPEARMHHLQIVCIFALLASGFWLPASSTAQGEIIDRIVAVVENRIITLSDVRQERRVQEALGENGNKDDKDILEELIEAHLIEDQIAQFPGIEVSPGEVDTELNKIRDLRGASPEAVREGIRRRVRTARYLDVRFRQFVRASDEEVQRYYEEIFLPEAQKRGLQPIPALHEVSDLVRANVIEEKVKDDVENWLETIRRRSNLEIFQ
jgi:hypothetical protein